MAYVPTNETVKLEGFAELEQQLLELAKGYRADNIPRNTPAKASEPVMGPELLQAHAKGVFFLQTTLHPSFTHFFSSAA